MKINRQLNPNNLINLSKKGFGGHHHITGKVDEQRNFVVMDSNTKSSAMFNIIGIQSDSVSKDTVDIVTPSRKALDISSFELFPICNDLHDIPDEENPYLHEDVIGYMTSDDVSNLIIIFLYIFTHLILSIP